MMGKGEFYQSFCPVTPNCWSELGRNQYQWCIDVLHSLTSCIIDPPVLHTSSQKQEELLYLSFKMCNLKSALYQRVFRRRETCTSLISKFFLLFCSCTISSNWSLILYVKKPTLDHKTKFCDWSGLVLHAPLLVALLHKTNGVEGFRCP